MRSWGSGHGLTRKGENVMTVITPLPFKEVPKDAMRGRSKAWSSSTGLLNKPLEQAMSDFRALTSEDARAAYADKWISLTAVRLEEAWPMLYELLRIVKERELWKREASLEGQKTYLDFASYFEARTGKPFAVWGELETTYTFVATYRPELLQQLYQV